MIIRYLDPLERLEYEILQLSEEGRDVSVLDNAYQSLLKQPAEQAREQALEVLISNAQNYKRAAHEPDEYEAIKKQSQVDPQSKLAHKLDDNSLYEKILGGWLGRSAGCLLGKPVERYARPVLREMLEANGSWPLSDYWTQKGMPESILEQYPWKRRGGLASLRENIECMPEDDDLNYTMLNLHVFEQQGPGFCSEDLGGAWLGKLPVNELFTAERVTYFNLLSGLDAPESATYINPFREWIGAQIRADFWGYISPGNPKQAAEYAWRDARLSHSGNGIYGEMFFAALIASAFDESDIRTLVKRALCYVPSESRFAKAINTVLSFDIDNMSWEEVVDEVYAHFGHYHWVHTINNAALSVAALLVGNADLEKTMCNVVMGGWDTDSNGATVGSIVGIINGASNLPKKWVRPLNNRIRSSMNGFDNAQFTDLASRTVTLLNKSACTQSSSAINRSDDF